MESIPLRVLVLLIDEIFGVRAQNAWFRRRLVAILKQFVDAAMGSSINRKIIDLVQWLTSEQQVAQYLIALRYFVNSRLMGVLNCLMFFLCKVLPH